MTFTIKAKLIAAFGFVVILTTGALFLAVRGLDEQQDALHALLNREFAKVLLAEDIIVASPTQVTDWLGVGDGERYGRYEGCRQHYRNDLRHLCLFCR